MRVELTEFKRCCCCFPLRYGLLALGYLKLVISMLLIVPVIIDTVRVAGLRSIRSDYVAVAVLTVFLLILLADTVLTVVFIVGGHKKCPKLLRVYNYYCIGHLVFFTLVFVLYHAVQMYHAFYHEEGMFYTLFPRTGIVGGLLNISFQVYMILMNKSEIAKLESNCSFRFSNKAKDGECTMFAENNEGNEA